MKAPRLSSMSDAVQVVTDLQERLRQREKQLVECDRAMSQDGILRPGGMLVGHHYLAYVDYMWAFGRVEALDLISPMPSMLLSKTIAMSPVNTNDIGFMVNGIRSGFDMEFVEGMNAGAPSGSMIEATFLGEMILYLKALNWAIPVAEYPGFHGILEPHGETPIQASQGSEVS